MYSYAWMNGQHQQVGPPSESPQATTPPTHDTMRNLQTGAVNNSCHYRTAKMGGTFQEGAYLNRHMSNWQTSAAPNQPVSPQQPSGGNNGSYLNVLRSNCHNSTTMQSGNHCLPVTNGFQVATNHNFYQNSKLQTPPNAMSTCPKQDKMAHWNQIGIRDGTTASDVQHCGVNKRLYHQVTGKQIKPYSAQVTPATSLPHEEVVYTSTLVSPTAHNRQTAHNQNRRQNVTQHGFCPSTPLPNYSTAVSQSLINRNITTNSSSSGQIWHSTGMGQKTQQYSAQLNSLHNNGGEATSSINSYSNSWFLQKINEHLVDPAAELRIARIADNLRKSCTAGSDGRYQVHNKSSYKGKQFVELNQTMQPMTSVVAKGYNSNATQLLPLHSLPNTTQGVMPRAQHIVNAPPQHSSVPDVFCVTTTGDKSGNGSMTGSAFFPKNSTVSKGNLVGYSNDASQLMLMPESISPQRTATQSSDINNREMLEILEMLSLVKQNDTSIHSSPGRTGTRAVAVVQPLSQESYQVANKHTSPNNTNQLGECIATDESLCNAQKLFNSPAAAQNSETANVRQGFHIYPESPKKMRSNKHVIRRSASFNDSSVVSSSDDKGSEVAANMQVAQGVALAAQHSVTSEVPVNQNGNTDNTGMPTDPKACVCDLSSVPTTPWTIATLTKLILDAEKAQMELEDFTKFDSANKVLGMFWDGHGKNLACKLGSGWYKDLITEIKEFGKKHLTPDCVILSQVTQSPEKQLKSYYVLKDNEAYSELPYKSSWLNINEQVDDIDKEFGFPWSWMHRFHMLESLSHSDQVGTVNSIPAQVINKVPNEVLSQTELEPVDSGEEKQASTADDISTQTSSPSKKESDDSSDPYYSFEIHVLPPEEAKIIFGQISSSQSSLTSGTSSTNEFPDVTEVTLSEPKLKNEVVLPIEHICCIDKWLEKFGGSDQSKCRCNEEQSNKDCTDKALEKEEMTVPKNDKSCAVGSNSQFHSPVEGQDQAKGRENIDNPFPIYIWPDLCKDLSLTTELIADDHKPDSLSDEEAKNISQISINDSQSSVILISETKAEDLSSSEIPSQIPDSGNLMSDPEEECLQDQLKSAGSNQSSCSDNGKREIQKVSNSEAASHMSDPEEDCAQAQLTSTDVAESSLEMKKGQTEISAKASLQTTFSFSRSHERVERKRKTLSSNEQSFPFLKKLKNYRPSVNLDAQPVSKGSTCKKGFVDAADSESSASDVRTVELVLFGSSHQGKGVLTRDRKHHFSSLGSLSEAVERPPAVLFVALNPSRRKSSVPALEHSVKHSIYEKWRRSYLPTKIRHRRKLTTKKYTSLSGVNLKKVETAVPTNTKELPDASERRTCNGNTKRSLSLKRRKSFANNLGEENMMNHAVTLERPHQERSDAEDGSHAVMPLEENSVLKFSVLPNTFNFVDGSKRRKESTDPVSDNADFVERKDKSPCITILRAKGTWFARPEKKYYPLHSPSVPKTSIVFQEFQKKYIEKTQPSTA
ncbi:uncharacterized protein LOC111661819 [Seriola lalandi dorsalis]|uniref:uncharacterized protein LOC111661819 n=1 Tax=Seriola lalandi dorsalis TaxID=1841481 RepID=UPI000C6F57F5|nr:uncharacterized protein LOC111661819 [Seriola lalandi dorsalis]